MNIQKYLSRIGFKGKLEVSLECLKQLHKCHVMSIPFEALDVQYGKEIKLDLDSIFKKVIERKRGGYCYELNYLFHMILTEIGFSNHIISARIYDNGKYGPAYDHMAILVKMDEELLIDVGYGDLFVEPLRMLPNIQQTERYKTYKLQQSAKDKMILLESLNGNTDYQIRYSFNLQPQLLDDFQDQNDFKQSSVESYFVKNRICTLATEEGRKTIFNDSYKVTTNGEVERLEIESAEDLKTILKSEFDITIHDI